MRKPGSNYSKLTALCIVLAMSLVQGVSANKINAPSPNPSGEVNLSSEARTIDSFDDDLTAYNKKGFELSKKALLTSDEFGVLDRNGNDLKQRVSQVRAAVESIIGKLKAANRWNNLDEETLAKLTDTEDRAFIQKKGGLRRIFENAVTELNSQAADEIVTPLGHLRPKVGSRSSNGSNELAWRMVAATYETRLANPSTSTGRSARCIGATIRFSTRLIVTGNGSATLNSNMHCYCDGGPRCRPGDTSIMVW